MELKKNDKANLEKRKGLFFQIGLVVALGVVLLAFEWKQKPPTTDDANAVAQVTVEEEIAQVTRPPEVKAPPPPPKVTEVLNLVEDNVKLDDDLKLDVESDDKLALSSIAYVETAKATEEEVVEETPFVMVEDMPQFQGGSSDTFREWIAKNLKYPEIASENGISGRVYIQFCVNSKGDIVDVVVLRGVDPALDKEAVRVVSSSPKWTPGKQRGKAVKVQFTFPVNFVLQ
ncbi:MAG TPA: energy transducer TonB [Bacteroidales bacterium]|nr:energy transducer TonB [Bacteroidales bacterium]